jgi:glyoxylase-like metal-dependent hydrolase (beta-lactamase superfamily II)
VIRAVPVTAQITQLVLCPRTFAVNVYLVREPDGFTLVDTGPLGCADDILAAAAHAGDAIRRVAVTHAHPDHTGSLDALHRLLPEAEILAGKREARFLAGDRSLDMGERGGLRLAALSTCAVKPTRLLVEGDCLGSLAVTAVPGHTPGHLAFLDSRSNALIAGDAFQTRGGAVVAGQINFFPFPALFTCDRQLALESARKIIALQPRMVLVGHGPPLVDPLPALERAASRG